MRFLLRGGAEIRRVVAVCGVVCALSVAGCGTPGAPQPPSLKLPEPVTDLTAVRDGSVVALHWTMPRKTTDKLLLTSQVRGAVPVRVCRREGSGDACVTAGQASFAPEAEAEFRETLPAAESSGEARPLIYFVELPNKNGRSAGLSNAAVVIGGAAPGAIAGLKAEVRANGVALLWDGPETTAVRLHRKLLTPAAPKAATEKRTGSGIAGSEGEPVLRDFMVDAFGNAPGVGGALDSSARFGEVYEYSAQRVKRVTVKGKTLELAGDVSAPVRVEVIDRFPPAVPQGLAAVASPKDGTIDLSWQPDTDTDLAGYIVYRVEAGASNSADGIRDWIRVSGDQLVASPAYRDGHVEAGHGYRYAVSAVDLTGHESKRSAEAEESLPNP